MALSPIDVPSPADSPHSLHILQMTALQHSTEHSYLLGSDEPEAERLQSQHKFLVELYENRIVLAPVLLNTQSAVLDVGTGTGVWALDLVEKYPNADQASVICIDVRAHFFPKDYPPNVTFELASVLALRAEWENRFALVHQRLLVSSLKYDEWSLAIQAIFRVTAPGGWAQLCEVDPSATICGPRSAQGIQLARLVHEKIGQDLACTERIAGLLSEAGFVDVRIERCQIKFGRWGGDEGVRCAENVIGVWRALKIHALRAGGFGVVKNEEEFDRLMDDVKEEWDTQPGAKFGWFIFVAKKPE